MTELTMDEEGVERRLDGALQKTKSTFLPRSEIEIESDGELLNVLQSSYTLIAAALDK